MEYIRNIERGVGAGGEEGGARPTPPPGPLYSLYILYIFPEYFPYMFPCVFLDLWSQQKTSPLFSGGFRPHLELLGHDGHVQGPTFCPISYITLPKLVFYVISK